MPFDVVYGAPPNHSCDQPNNSADPVANAAKGFLNPLTGTSGADNIIATSSNQLLTGYELVTGTAGVATQAGQIDVLGGALA